MSGIPVAEVLNRDKLWRSYYRQRIMAAAVFGLGFGMLLGMYVSGAR